MSLITFHRWLAGFALAGLALASGSAPAAAQATQPRRVVCLGDSITWGLIPRSNVPGGGSTHGYLGPLGRWLDANWQEVDLFNEGVQGETSAGGRDRVDSVLGSRPDMLLIMYGTNDVTQIWQAGNVTEGINDTIANLRAIGDQAVATGAEPVLATIIPRNGGSADASNTITHQLNSGIRGLASGRGWKLADQEENFESRPRFDDLYSENIHPNEPGYEVLAEEWAAAISGVPRSSIDLTAPYMADVLPPPGTRSASPGAPIKVTLRDLGTGIDQATVGMRVNGATVQPIATGTDFDLTLTYQPPSPWPLGQTVSVAIDVQDRAAAVNAVTLSYSYQVSGGNGTGGDIDGSGRVDGGDLVRLALAFGASKNDSRYDRDADLDLDGVVDGSDLSYLAERFGETL